MKAKKLTSILLILAIIVTMAISAFAAPVETGSITVSNVGDVTTLEVYKILEYTYDDSVNGYSQVSFTKTEYSDVFATVLGQYGYVEDTGSVSEMMLYITNTIMKGSDKDDFARELAEALELLIGSLKPTPNATKSDSETVTDGKFVFDLDVGYYLVLDTTGVGNDKYSALAMLTPLGSDVDVVLKSSSTTIPDKKIEDITKQIFDSIGNSVSIGDTVDFSITIEIPNYAQYGNASFKVYDIMGAGYKFDATTAVATIDGTVMSTGMTVTVLADTERATAVAAMLLQGVTVADDATLIEFGFGNINETFKGQIGKSLVISYPATVDVDADDINANDAIVLENGTYIVGNGMETFTYGFEVNKSDEYGNELEGVKFFLATSDDLADSNIKYLMFDDETGTYLFDGVAVATDAPNYNPTTNEWTVAPSLSLDTNANGYFKVFGLEAGTYYLYEYKTLAGYNLLTAPVEVIISTDTISQYTYDIVNNSGIELPSTGGIGTIMFGIFGCLIIVGGVTGCTMLVIKLKRRYSASR